MGAPKSVRDFVYGTQYARKGKMALRSGGAAEMSAEIAYEYAVPAAVVAFPRGLRPLTERLPAAMDQAHPRPAAFRRKAELDDGVRVGGPAGMPGHGEAG